MKDIILIMWKVFWLLCGCILCNVKYTNGQQELGDIDLGCPQGSYRHDGFCYILWPGRMHYPDAEITCQASGGLLAPIKDLETQKFLRKLYMRKFHHNFWIGLTDKKIEGKWEFSDNTSISTFNKWDHGQPDNYGGAQHCAQMWMLRNLHWDDLWCDQKLRYICEYKGDECSTCNRFPRYGQSCYELSKDFVTYDDADKNCKNRGGILAAIKNLDTYNFLKKIIYAERFWLNMTEEELQSIPNLSWSLPTWIGIKSVHNSWIYSDGTPVNYTNWAPGKPSNVQNPACVRFTKTDNRWENDACNSYLPFICQYPAKIWYDALTNAKLLPDGIFKQFAELTCDAALKLLGSDTRVAVCKALTEVGVLAPSPNFIPVYQQGDPGYGIGGYNLKSAADRAFAFDYNHSGKLDHLVLYRPAKGTLWILQNNNGAFSPVYKEGDPGNGIGGYNLWSAADRVFAFDYDHSGKLDHLALYRPGTGTFWILKNNKGVFAAVYAEGDPGKGIGGYNLASATDRAFAFDYDHSGKQDHVVLYRPGTGTMWILKNVGGKFSPVYAEGDPGKGIGGYDLKSPADRAFAFDFDHSGKKDHIVLYRPGTGTLWILKNKGGKFTPVYNQGDPGQGIGGYNLRSLNDRVFEFDYDGSGKLDYLALYRPPTGTIWILKHVGKDFVPVYKEGDPGNGIAGYNLKSLADRVFCFDYSSRGTMQNLVLYRPGTGTIWILPSVSLYCFHGSITVEVALRRRLSTLVVFGLWR